MKPAKPEEVAESLSFALRYSGRRRARDADAFMADLLAKRLVEHLERSGFVIMKRPDAPAPSAPSR